MTKCYAPAYGGNERYVFASYCPCDSETVFPIIEEMAKNGYRVWYDDGETDAETLNARINGCGVFLGFISNSSVHFPKCVDEINFAFAGKKYFFSVALEPMRMETELEREISNFQSIAKFALPTDEGFYGALFGVGGLAMCKGEPIALEAPTAEDAPAVPVSEAEPITAPIDEASLIAAIEAEAIKLAEEEARLAEEEEARRIAEEEARRAAEEEEARRRAEEAARIKQMFSHALKREKTGELVFIKKNRFMIGSSVSDADLVLDGGDVSSVHATAYVEDGKCYIVCGDTEGKNYIGGNELVSGERYELKSRDIIKLADEKLIYLNI